jgi:hypothetical protein
MDTSRYESDVNLRGRTLCVATLEKFFREFMWSGQAGTLTLTVEIHDGIFKEARKAISTSHRP